MKKLLLLAVICLAFISCKNNSSSNEPELTPIPRSEWDADNIYMTNTSKVKYVGFKRESGTTGILGKFSDKYSSLSIIRAETYEFFDTGYFTWTYVVYYPSDPNLKPKKETSTGKYKIYKSEYEELFIIETSSLDDSGGTKNFFQVNSKELWKGSSYKINETDYVYP